MSILVSLMSLRILVRSSNLYYLVNKIQLFPIIVKRCEFCTQEILLIWILFFWPLFGNTKLKILSLSWEIIVKYCRKFYLKIYLGVVYHMAKIYTILFIYMWLSIFTIIFWPAAHIFSALLSYFYFLYRLLWFLGLRPGIFLFILCSFSLLLCFMLFSIFFI